MKVVTTLKLLQMLNHAMRLGYSRQLSPATRTRLDPYGKHVLSGAMVHDDVVNVRCLTCLLKMKDQEEPLMAVLDFTFEDFNKLPEATPVQEAKS